MNAHEILKRLLQAVAVALLLLACLLYTSDCGRRHTWVFTNYVY